MTDRATAVKAYVKAFCGAGQAASEEAARYIAHDVDLVSPPLHVCGLVGVLERISGHWPGMGMYAQGKWSEPALNDGIATISAELPPGMPTKSISITFAFNGEGKIKHIDTVQTRGEAPPPGDVKLTDEIKALVNNSLDDGCPMVVGYVGPDGHPNYRSGVACAR